MSKAGGNSVLPLFFNPDAGSTGEVLEALGQDHRVNPIPVKPEELESAVKAAVADNESRVLISGGDGTLALAASALVGTGTELAVIPGGTLNHFASRFNIPLSPGEALDIALQGRCIKVGVGYVNNNMFLNTSSVGAYPKFVKIREHLKGRMSYHVASFFAGMRRLIKFNTIRVKIGEQELQTPLVFVGVGEREMRFPHLGQTKPGGEEGLHVVAVDSNSRLENIKLVCAAIFLGTDPLSKDRKVQSELMNEVEVNVRRRKRVHVALDGEVLRVSSPLRYLYKSSCLNVVVPTDIKASKASRVSEAE